MERRNDNIFPTEAMARYFEWCGASRHEAIAYASGNDALSYDIEKDRPEWMPMNEACGVRYTSWELHEHLAEFTRELPGGFDAWGWGTSDPYAVFGSDGDGFASQAGPAEASDTLVLGLTGGRGAGKSYLCEILEEMEFTRVHPFNPGKATLRGYYVSRGATEEQAMAMTDGALKDLPAPDGVLPVDIETGRPHTSRFVMERLGQFMARRLGLDSTIGRELAHWSHLGAERVLVDSVVYEDAYIRTYPNAVIMRLDLAEGLGNSGIQAETSDRHVAQIVPDVILVNYKDGRENLEADFLTLMAERGFDLGREIAVFPEL